MKRKSFLWSCSHSALIAFDRIPRKQFCSSYFSGSCGVFSLILSFVSLMWSCSTLYVYIVLCVSYDMCEFDGNSFFFFPLLLLCIHRNEEDGIGIRLFSCNFHVIPKELTPCSHKYSHPVNSLGFISPSTPPSMCPGYFKQVFCILTLLPEEEDVSHTLAWNKKREYH